MLHWPKKSLVMSFYYINFDQNGPPYEREIVINKLKAIRSKNPLDWAKYKSS